MGGPPGNRGTRGGWGREVADERWRKDPEGPFRAPCGPLKDSAGYRQPQSSPWSWGMHPPNLSPLTADGCFGGVPTALLPCVWTSRDQLRWNSLGSQGAGGGEVSI